ncbi:MAG: SufD family Fe-S cluster assembly protein [Clostridia bacterium]|nr:SufD family Fe-S cluster assembly protein [Clostridia bacterium]
MDKLSKIDKELLTQIADLHGIPQGSYNIRKNGKLLSRASSEDIQIVPKKNKDGIDIIVKSGIKNKSVHIPVIVTKAGFKDLVYNDFYIGDNAEVTIVAGCGIHNTENEESGHNGIHSFHIGKNARVVYIEKHLALGKGKGNKILNPTTNITMDTNSYLEMQTIQLGGVTYSNRKTKAKLKQNSELSIKEKILTTNNQQAKTSFVVDMTGEGCKCNVVSRSVARDSSVQEFKSKLVGKSNCFGRVECDAILLDNARVTSIPEIDARCVDATLNHEATVGKIAGEQLIKLMTLGLTQQEAEDVIIKGYLK